MSELRKMILLGKQGNKFALEKLIDRFNPSINSNIRLIDSYKSLNKYDLEDNKQEIILALINAVKVIPLEKDSFKNDGKITNYINKAIQNKRLEFSKRFSRNEKVEYKSTLNCLEDLFYYESFEKEIIVKDLLSKLDKKEKFIIKKKILVGKSDVEIGEMLDISRQAVNKTKNKALKKLKTFYY
ncbi:sigma-70 family RNA polymerase sigma factor [Clostridium perfringens]|uniref:sigma-70 family RNA polymerase sigma factor n=1 Tax=Clostridium perfringens TaxID=1502 RepID=UPI0039EAD4A7